MIQIAFVILVFGALISVIYGQKEGQDFVSGCFTLIGGIVLILAGAIACLFGYGLIVGLIVAGVVVLYLGWGTVKYLIDEGSIKTTEFKVGLGFLGILAVVLFGLWKVGANSIASMPQDTVATPTYTPVDTGTGGGYASYGNKSFGIMSQIANSATCANYGITYTGNSLWVASVVPGSSAERAKIPTGVIVEVDGLAPDSQELTEVKARHNVGDWISFKIVTPDRRWWNYWVQLGG